MSACPDETTVVRYVEGACAPDELRDVEAHFSDCSACRERIRHQRANEDFLGELRGMVVRQRHRSSGSDLVGDGQGDGSGTPGRQGSSGGGSALFDTSMHDGEIKCYQLLEEIQRGAQGVVYKAVQKATKRTVALKVLLYGPYASERDQRRFEREIELAASLRHPNIVTVYESGVAQGRCYLAMEYVDGVPLDRYVRGQGLDHRGIMALFAKVCRAVAYAHQQGVIHRDLKPGNILVDVGGEPHVLDFGLAKAADRERHALGGGTMASVTGQVLGTPAYMSPEQASGRPSAVDVRSDVYSLGVILYRLMTGELPYDVSGPIQEVLRRIEEDEPTRPAKIADGLDGDIQTIMLKALEKDPSRRYQSATELHHDIVCWLEGMPIVARSASSLYVLRKLMRRHRYTSTVVGLVFVILVSTSVVSLDSLLQAKQSRLREADGKQALERNAARLGEISEVALSQSAFARRQMALAWILSAWREGGSVEAARVSREELPEGCRERAAARFLLDPMPVALKIDAFRSSLGRGDLGFVEFIVGEHHLRDGDRSAAMEAFRRCVRLGPNDWFADRARSRLESARSADASPNPTTRNARGT